MWYAHSVISLLSCQLNLKFWYFKLIDKNLSYSLHSKRENLFKIDHAHPLNPISSSCDIKLSVMQYFQQHSHFTHDYYTIQLLREHALNNALIYT